MVDSQCGDASYILDTEKFEKAPYTFDIIAAEEGYIVSMNTEKCGIASCMLGAGRVTMDSKIDISAGIIIHKKVGDWVTKGDVLATMHTSNSELFDAAEKRYREAITIENTKPKMQPLIYARITKEKIERLVE